MNERIKDLKEEALVWATETLDPDELDEYEWSDAIYQKFAELIIKECSKLVETRNPRYEPAPHIYLLKAFDIKNEQI